MAKGGKRPGAGRKPGKVSSAKRDLMAMARGYCPDALRVLVAIMKDAKQPASARASAATGILDRGYGRPPQAVHHQGAIGTYDLSHVSDDDLSRLETILGPLADDSGDQG